MQYLHQITGKWTLCDMPSAPKKTITCVSFVRSCFRTDWLSPFIIIILRLVLFMSIYSFYNVQQCANYLCTNSLYIILENH